MQFLLVRGARICMVSMCDPHSRLRAGQLQKSVPVSRTLNGCQSVWPFSLTSMLCMGLEQIRADNILPTRNNISTALISTYPNTPSMIRIHFYKEGAVPREIIVCVCGGEGGIIKIQGK